MREFKKLLLSNGYIRHRFNRAKKSGHIITKVAVNGYKGRFIIDTGASATCIDQSLYKEFSLETEYMDSEIGTASGSMKPRISHRNTVELSDWSDEDMSLLVIDMTFINTALKSERMHSVQGLLGADFLFESKAIIDYGGKWIYLKL